jgi:Mlc titration factor MtfA (ptsG expression regulator)
MLVTPEIDRRNRRSSMIVAALLDVTVTSLSLLGTPVGWPVGYVVGCLIAGALFGLAAFWLSRRKCRRRLRLMSRPFPAEWEAILQSRVAYYSALNAPDKDRFRKLVQIFLGEVRVTGIRTDIDDTIRLLVASSAVIPIFGFHDWDYSRLSEVLVYPDSFNDEYQSEGEDRHILGMTGLASLSGVMILSKPALLEGYHGDFAKENVGIHEFAHLLEQEAESRGLPAEVPHDTVREWIAFVARELKHPQRNRSHINEYGYKNESEFFAVLTEYFFKSPDTLQQLDPALYEMLRKIFHQDPASLFGNSR